MAINYVLNAFAWDAQPYRCAEVDEIVDLGHAEQLAANLAGRLTRRGATVLATVATLDRTWNDRDVCRVQICIDANSMRDATAHGIGFRTGYVVNIAQEIEGGTVRGNTWS